MTATAGKNRDRLERDLVENPGEDAEKLHQEWGEHRRSWPFEHVDREAAAKLLGPQRGAYGGPAADLYIAWAHDDVAQVMRDADHFMKPGPGGPFSGTI